MTLRIIQEGVTPSFPQATRKRNLRLTRTPKYGGHGNQGGPVNESDRLRPAFCVWCGKRSYAAALKAAGIEYAHGMRWLSGGILREADQVKVRVVLFQADLLPDLLPGSAG